jgi:hypothetical protein
MERRTAHLALYDGAPSRCSPTSIGPASGSAEYLAMTGCTGGGRYVDELAVDEGDLMTAGPQSPVQFAREDRD